MMETRHALALFTAALLALPALSASAVTRGTPVRGGDDLRRSVVRIESAIGVVCSGVLVAPDIVLTAAHCMAARSRYVAIIFDERFHPQALAVSAILEHPSFVAGTEPNNQPGSDLALARLERNVPDDAAATLAVGDMAVPPETELRIAGYGTSSYRNKRSARILRSAPLVVVATHQPPNDLIFAADRRLRARSPGAGACLGDSGGPALVATAQGFAVGGIISWAAGAGADQNVTPCGGLTVITPVKPNSGWIARGIEQLHR